MDYSYRYARNGYVSAFLEDINSIHIGRLTSQRNNKNIPNAYDLNEQDQFTKSQETVKAEHTPHSEIPEPEHETDIKDHFEFIPRMDQMALIHTEFWEI